MKEFFGKIFNRFSITAILILIQAGWYVILLFALANYSSWISLAFTVMAALIALYVIWRDDNPAFKVGWILLICLLPVLGGTMYIFFGNKRPSKAIRKKMDIQEELHRGELNQELDLKGIMSTRMIDTVRYIGEGGPYPYPIWGHTDTEYFPLGEKMYEKMLEDLENAQHYIFMEYFIISEGKMIDTIGEILIEKADAGLDVRITYDDMGSIHTMPRELFAEMKAHGIQFLPFNPMKPILSLVYNNRNHRKITVIDGYIGYSGGINIADEYINIINRFGHWKDTGIRIEGDAVWNFTVMFLNMWNAFKKTDHSYEHYKPHVWQKDKKETDGFVQPFADSPLDDENVGENVYLEILSQAEDYVYIITPYLIIDNEMKTSLELAAKRGVDVRIVTPGIPDKKTVYQLTRSYYAPLIKVGVKIYEYVPGFIHAKSYIADDKIGVVGTINMDYRSLYLHFECGMLLIGGQVLKDLKMDCIDTFSKCRLIEKDDCRKGFFGTLYEAILRVVSPLL